METKAKYCSALRIALSAGGGVMLAAPLCAMAQTGAETPDSRPIMVLGDGLALPPGTPAYGSVTITRDRLESDSSGRVENALRDVAGFQQFRRSDSRSANPSAQGATLRALGGNASSRTLVLLDGVPMADPFFGYIPFSALSADRLSAVRVTRGGGGGAFGAGAVAGTIEMASAGRDALPLASAQALYGSRDSSELSASLSPDVGAGFVSISGRWDRGDGFQTTPADQRSAATVPARYNGWSLGLRAVAPVGANSEIQARALLFRDDRTLRFAGADSGSEGGDASIRLIHRGAWQVDALAYLQARNFSNIVISATSFRKTLDQRDTPSTGIGGKLELRPPVGDAHVLRIGADARIADGDLVEDQYSASTGLITDTRRAGGRTSVAGVFVEDDWTLGRLVLTGGARADHWGIRGGYYQSTAESNEFADRDGWRATLRGGALWHVSGTLALRAAAYSGFRLPTLNELYRPFTVFPVRTEANEALTPEKLRGVEGGVDVALGAVRVNATLFYNRLDDAIANVTIGTNLRQRRNVDAVEAKGVELTGDARLGDFTLSASYAYSDARVIASGTASALNGKRPAQSPQHAASATLGWTPHAGGPMLSTTLRYTGAQFEDDLEVDRMPDAITLDAYARLPLARGFALVARGENLFDEAVVTRNVAGSIDLGTPRTLWIGVRWEG